MTHVHRWRALAGLAAVVMRSATAAAEVPKSRIAPPPPPEVRLERMEPAVLVDPVEQAAWIRDYHGARRFRSAGIVFISVGTLCTPLGLTFLVDAMHVRATGRDIVGARYSATISNVLLTIGGPSLLLGIPMFAYGVSVQKPAAMPTVQIGLSNASLLWSF